MNAPHPVFIFINILIVVLMASAPILAKQDEQGRHLIPEVIALPDHQSIPESVYRHYDSRIIGESIVHRIAEHRRRQPIPSNVRQTQWNPLQHAEIILYINENVVGLLPEFGILNQHQAVSSASTYNAPSSRAQAEDQWSGLSLGSSESLTLGTAAARLRPRYATVNVRLAEHLGPVGDMGQSYGQVLVVLNNNVLPRTTITRDDSSHPSIWRGSNEVRPIQETGLLLPDEQSHYFEAQIWGDVDLTDISEFRVPSHLSENSLNRLRRLGLPIYRYNTIYEHGRSQIVRGEQIYSGDPLRTEELRRMAQQQRQARSPHPIEVPEVFQRRYQRALARELHGIENEYNRFMFMRQINIAKVVEPELQREVLRLNRDTQFSLRIDGMPIDDPVVWQDLGELVVRKNDPSLVRTAINLAQNSTSKYRSVLAQTITHSLSGPLDAATQIRLSQLVSQLPRDSSDAQTQTGSHPGVQPNVGCRVRDALAVARRVKK